MESDSKNGHVGFGRPVTAWMPLYCGDYLRDTMHLTNAQHGAYLKAIMGYWCKGESLTDEELRGIGGVDYKVVTQFFVWCDDRWHHKRIDQELKKARDMAKAARAKAMKGVERRRQMGLLPKNVPTFGEKLEEQA